MRAIALIVGAAAALAPVAATAQSATPTVSSISPGGGSTGGGTPVTITGTGFISYNTYTATFGGATVAATYANATTLTATAPAGTGSVQVTVTNTTTGQVGTGSATFVYGAPTVTAISPNSGPANQTRAVTITGTNFTPGATVSVGGTSATNVTYISATQLTATLPARAAGTYDVLVTTGSVTSAAGPASQYTYVPAPVVMSITPNGGTTAGGTPVTIAGTNFAGATTVTIGGTAVGSFTVVSATQIDTTTPAGAAGAANVVVTTAGGTATLVGGYTYVALSAPTVQTQPANQEVAVGATATFAASGTGTPTPTAQWQSAPAGSAVFTDIGGATGTSYTTPATVAGDNGRQYRVVFTNSEGTATSSAATLTVVQAPTANAQTVAVAFDTATPITLTGTDPNTPARTLTYQVATQPAHGTLSGAAPNLTYTPTAGYAGADSFTFTASNGTAVSQAATISITVGQGSQTITFTSTAPASARVRGTSYTVTATATSGQPVSFTSLTTNICTVSGATVDFVGAGTCTIAANQAGNTTYTAAPEATQSFTVSGPTIAFSPRSGGLPAGTVGVPYSLSSTASGGTAPYTYAITAGALPPGLTLNTTTGTISGRPTRGGTASFTVTATDSTTGTGAPFTGSAAYTLTIQAPTIVVAPASLPDGTAGQAYSQQLFASGGTSPYTFAITAGALAPGLSLSTSGLLTGTPTQGGSFNFTVSATDSSTGGTGANGGYTGSRSYTFAVTAPTITIAPATLPNATTGQPYSQALTASGGSGSYAFAVTAGALPAGITLATDGTLAGTPTAAGTFNFTITATDGGGFTSSRAYTFSVAAATIALTPNTLADATRGAAYNQNLTATGGTAPYAYSVTAGALPAGLTLASSGTLSGSATQTGSFTFTITARDSSTGSGPFVGSRTYTLAVTAAAIVVTPDTLPAGTTRVAYSQALTANGGTGPYTYAVTAGALPGGLTLSNGGTLSGSATTAGTFNFTATATDSFGNTGSRSYTLTIAAPAITLAPTTLPAATTRVAYSQAITASGGTSPYAYAVTAGALPAGLTLSTAGTLSGTPIAAGSFNFSVTATDANGNSGAQAYTLTVAAPAIVLAPATLSDGTVGTSYSGRVSATGGSGSFTYAVTTGALPAGLTLASDGLLAGTPTAGGSFGFTVTATDANGNTGNRTYTLQVAAPAIALTPATLLGATTRVAYRQNITASGGVAPYRYAVTAGALPAGLTLAADGTLAGTPTASGSFGFTVTATDSATGTGPYAGSQTYTLVVAAPNIALTPATLPGGAFGAAYTADLTASGGTAPYAYAISAGALPGGLTLSGTGRLAGTPTAAGSFSFNVTATDANGNVGAQAYMLAIAKAAQTITFANPGAQPLSNSPVTLTGSSSSGLAPAFTSTTTGVCTVSGNTLTLVQTGTCTIAADQAGNASYDPAATVTQSFAVAPAKLVVTQAQASVGGTVGTALSATPVTASGGTAPYNFALTGPLPAGLSFSATTGMLSGTPTGGQVATAYTVTVSDAGGQTATSSFTLAVAAPTITVTPTSLPAGNFQTAYSQQLSATGGIAPYRFAVTSGALPAGLTLSPAGLLSGTPTVGGSFTFTVNATDASTGTGPYSASQSYTLAVSLPAPPVAQSPSQTTATTSSTTAGQPVVIDLSSLVTGVYDTIEITTRPHHGTVSLAQRTQGLSRNGTRFLAEYIPNAGYAGADSFGFVAIGPGGRSAEATVAIAVAGSVPVAGAVRGTTLSAQSVIVDLTAGATNGPFTAARIVSVSPSDAVTTELIEGGTAANRTYQLRLTPGGRFSGTATVQYTLSNAFGTSAPALVTVTVAARPDPAQDPTVRGLVAAQAESARRFASAQTNNFMRRAEQLHGDGGASEKGQMGIRMNLPLPSIGGGQRLPDPEGARSEEAFAASGHAREVAGRELGGRAVYAPGALDTGRVATIRTGREAGGYAAAPSDTGPATADADGGSTTGRPVGSTSLWSGGAIEVGMRDATTRRTKLSLTSGGLSAGVDMKLADWITVGIGGGYGSDRTKVGGAAGRIDGSNVVGVGYASLQPARGLFIDGVFGGGSLSYDTRRAVAANAAVAIGHRKGSMLFGSLAAGFDRSAGSYQLSAYGRLDWLDANLRAYRENGSGIYDLAFAKRDLSTLSGVMGLRGALPMGAWTPRLRFEYRHDFSAAGGQSLDYAGLTGFGYRIDGDGWLRDAFSAELGTELRTGIWRFGVDIGGQLGQNSRSATIKGTIGAQF